MVLFELCVVSVLGLVLGSFATALVHRVPQGVNWVSRRSACPSCDHKLCIADLVPVLSWFASGGKCRHCKAPVSGRYALIEILVMGLCLVIYFVFGFGIESLFILALAPVLIALLIIDLDHMILPNQLVFGVGLIGLGRLVYVFLSGLDASFYTVIVPFGLSALVYGGLSFFLRWFLGRVLGKEALGFGDVKFFLAAGLWLGLDLLPHFLIISGLLGVCFGLIWRIMGKGQLFPFGPALIVTLFVLILFQGPFLN